MAKCIKPHQAHWALFFFRLMFHITYRPGLKNVKPGALSCMFDDLKEPPVPDTILSEGNFLLLQNNLLTQIKQASADVPSPPGVMLTFREELLWNEDKVFVPKNVRITILGVCHNHPIAGLFRVHKMLNLLKRTFWWPDQEETCKRYMNSCSTCTRKSTKNRTWDLLRLPVPDRP